MQDSYSVLDLSRTESGVGSSSSGEPTDPWASDSPSLAWAGGARMSVTTVIGVAGPPVAIQAFVARRAPCKFFDIVGEHPGRINPLPSKCIFLVASISAAKNKR